MGANWNFNPQEVQELNFEPVPVGNHRARIEEVVEKVSSKGNPMYEIKFKVSGHAGLVWCYLVFDQANSAMTNTKLKQIFESFKIPVGNLEPTFWKGKVGGIRIKHEEYQGKIGAKIAYFLDRKNQETLPEWKESAGVASATNNGAPFAPIEDKDIQF